MSTPTTLWEYYTGSGQKLPPIRERAVLYESYGLGSAAAYTGTAQQNTVLLEQLLQGPPRDTIPGVEDALAILEQNRAVLESITAQDILAALHEALGDNSPEFREMLAAFGLTFADVNDALSFFSGLPPAMTMYDLLVQELSGNAVELPPQVVEQLPLIQEQLPPLSDDLGFVLNDTDEAFSTESFSHDPITGAWNAAKGIFESETTQTIIELSGEVLKPIFDSAAVKVFAKYGLAAPVGFTIGALDFMESWEKTIGHGIDYSMQRFYYGVDEPLIDREQVIKDFTDEFVDFASGWVATFGAEKLVGATVEHAANEVAKDLLKRVGFAVKETQSIATAMFVNDGDNAVGVNMWGDQKRDVLFGSFGDDHIGGRGGNDVLYGSLGNDALDGGTGLDTAMFSAARTSYSVSRGASTYSVTGVDGTDTLNDIERLQFSDKKIALDLGQGEAAGNTVRLIGAAFDANFITPEFVGIGIDLFDSGASLVQVAELALGTSVYQSIAGSRSNVDFVNTVYRTWLGRFPPSRHAIFSSVSCRVAAAR